MIVVTGSAGYIGGQTVIELKKAGHSVIGIDIRDHSAYITEQLDVVIKEDFISELALGAIVNEKPDAIIHCAGSSLVGPSNVDPSTYYENNFVKTKILADVLLHNGLHDTRLVFSSSASVYGEPVMVPCQEEDPALPISPYGETKQMVELLLNSYRIAYGLQSVILRYFNACGADPDCNHGHEANDTHLIPRVLDAIYKKDKFTLFGNTLNTRDGTCIRDYVHVSDIANAHVLAINKIVPDGTYNLASEEGFSNTEIIKMCEEVTGQSVKVVNADPRPGDPDSLFATNTKFANAAGWKPTYTLEEIVQHAWKWHSKTSTQES